MEQFELTGLLRTVLIIIVVYYGFRFIFRLLKPMIIRKGMEEMNRRQSQFQQGQNTSSSRRQAKEGEVTIEKPNTKGGKSASDPDGEYVDFEEVKD